MKIILFVLLPVAAWSAPGKTFSVQNIKVQSQQKLNFQGQEGLLVKIQGVKKEVFLPLNEPAQKEDIVELLQQAESEEQPVNLKLTRAGKDLILYRSSEGPQVLALGADCQKTKTNDNPKLFCNKGYYIDEIEFPVEEAAKTE